MEWITQLQAHQLGIFVAIVAIVMWGLVTIARTMTRHQERMRMIEKGMHPDSPGETETVRK